MPTYGVGSGNSTDRQEELASTEYGLASLKMEDFFDGNGNPLPYIEIYRLIKKHKPDASDTDIENKIRDFLPKLEGISQKEKGFLDTEKGISGDKRALGMKKATDAYGLGVSAADRAYGAAGDTYGAAEESYALGQSSAKRGLQSSLGQAQQQASSLGGAMRSSAGGSSMGMRGAIGGQQTLAKGVESTYGAYSDKQTALTGAMGRAESAYGRAGGAYSDEQTRLTQGLGYAQETADISEDSSNLAYDKGMYGLRQDVEGEFEGDVSTWLANFKQGGRVPNKKQTFSQILSRIPDAGGS